MFAAFPINAGLFPYASRVVSRPSLWANPKDALFREDCSSESQGDGDHLEHLSILPIALTSSGTSIFLFFSVAATILEMKSGAVLRYPVFSHVHALQFWFSAQFSFFTLLAFWIF